MIYYDAKYAPVQTKFILNRMIKRLRESLTVHNLKLHDHVAGNRW